MRIFIVDDEEIACFGLRGMIGRIFTDNENEIYAFTSSVKALSEAERLRPDLIFLDITMPEMDGITFTEMVKKIYSPEIIVISGNDDYNFVRQCFKMNVGDYLLKPIEFDELKYWEDDGNAYVCLVTGTHTVNAVFKDGIFEIETAKLEPNIAVNSGEQS